MNRLLHRFLQRTIVEGSLEIVHADGRTDRYGDGRGTPVRIRFASDAAERSVILDPDLKLGEE